MGRNRIEANPKAEGSRVTVSRLFVNFHGAHDGVLCRKGTLWHIIIIAVRVAVNVSFLNSLNGKTEK